MAVILGCEFFIPSIILTCEFFTLSIILTCEFFTPGIILICEFFLHWKIFDLWVLVVQKFYNAHLSYLVFHIHILRTPQKKFFFKIDFPELSRSQIYMLRLVILCPFVTLTFLIKPVICVASSIWVENCLIFN